MKKITILALHLGYGGVESAITNLANMLISNYEIEIISVYKLYDKPAFEINENVKIKYLLEDIKPNREELKSSIKQVNIIKIVKEAYKSIKCLFLRKTRTIKELKKCDSDYIISSRVLFNNWVGKFARANIKKIAWEHNHPHGNKKYEEKVVNSCRNMHTLVLVSNSLNEYYQKLFKSKNINCKCVYIPNTISNVNSKLSLQNENRLISVGRLSKEKGYEDLIDVFNIIHQKQKDLTLDIIGDGKEKNNITKKIHDYKLEKYITLHGYQNKEYINKILSKSSIYLMTSFTESFGIVLIEAMSYGVPCIAFDSAEGANEIINDTCNGYLIPNRDKDEMARIVITLMSDSDLRKKMGVNACKSILKYSNNTVKDMWIELLKR